MTAYMRRINMRKDNRIKAVFVGALVCVLLVGCKPSQEKLNQALAARTQLIEARDAAEEKYLDIADTSLRSELNELGVKVSEIEQIDFANMSDKKIDERLPEIEAVLQEYAVVQSKLDGTYKEESEANAESAKNEKIDAYIINKTGFNIKSIVLHDKTKDTLSDNLLGDGVSLDAGYTLMGVVLEVHTESMEWEFLVTDEAGTQKTFECESLIGKANSGLSLTFNYDSATDAGTVEFGAY